MGKPGSPCTEKHLAFNTEFTKEPICTASHKYQKLKIAQLQSFNLPEIEYDKQLNEVLDKECLCIGLSNGVAKLYNIPFVKKQPAVNICPGPNIIYFSKVVSLQTMTDHIYGRTDIIENTPRPHMFISELQLYINYLKEAIAGNGTVLVDVKKIELITVQDITHKYKMVSIIQSEITADGYVKGAAKSYASDYAKVGRLTVLEKGKDEFKKKYYTEPHSEFTFDSLLIKNEDKDSMALESSVEFKSELQKSGEYIFYNLNFLSGFDKYPFLTEERISTIEFGYNQSIMLTGNINFPETFVPEEMPKNIKMMIPDSSIILQRICQVDGNNISYRITLQINRPLYFADEYPDFKAFYTAMFEALNEQIVFKKKAKP